MGSRAWRKPRVHLWPPSRSTSLPTTRLTSSSFPPSSERPLRNWSRARKSPRPREPVHLVASRLSRRPLSPRRLRRHPSPRRRPSRRSRRLLPKRPQRRLRSPLPKSPQRRLPRNPRLPRRPQPKNPQQRRQLRRVQRRQPKGRTQKEISIYFYNLMYKKIFQFIYSLPLP